VAGRRPINIFMFSVKTVGLTKEHKGVPAVFDVDLNVRKGEIYSHNR
jgi:hypothetical protein